MMDTGFSLAEKIPGRKGKRYVWGSNSADEFVLRLTINCQAVLSIWNDQCSLEL